MNINTFVKLFKNKVEELLNLEIIAPSKGFDEYYPGDWTFLYNCAVYDIIREYNKNKGSNLAICAEPSANKTPNGRGGYSDLLICSKDGKNKHIIMEHENFPNGRLLNTIKKLAFSKAKQKLLITYCFDDYPKEDVVNEICYYAKKYIKKGELYLLISKSNVESGEDYELEVISNATS